MWTDLRHGARTLLHDKGWTAVVVVSLALGIGANTALFSAVNSLFLRKLPVRDPDTLVRLKWSGRNDMVDRQQRLRVFGHRTRPALIFAARFRIRCSGSSSPTIGRWTICSPARRSAG